MIGTFAGVLIFTMLKELYEDLRRHKQDRELNHKRCMVSQVSLLGDVEWQMTRWKDMKAGNVVKIMKGEELPADILMIKSSADNGLVYVDTMNLDGETNLKEKVAPPLTHALEIE